MAKILYHTAATARAGYSNIDDIIGVFEDSHVFTPGEQDVFGIKSVSGTKAAVEAVLESKLPDTSAVKEPDWDTKITRPKSRFRIANHLAPTPEMMYDTNVSINP